MKYETLLKFVNISTSAIAGHQHFALPHLDDLEHFSLHFGMYRLRHHTRQMTLFSSGVKLEKENRWILSIANCHMKMQWGIWANEQD